MIGHRLALVAAAAALLSSSSVLAADDVLTIGFTVSRTGKLKRTFLIAGPMIVFAARRHDQASLNRHWRYS
jgi:hypothetical protein